MQAISQQKFLLPVIRFTVFFILFYLYIWLRIDPSLIYHSYSIIPFPIFYRGMDFLKGFLLYPGGLIEYISALLSQFYYFPYLGSFIITVVTLLICLATGKFITAMGNTRFRAVIYIPAILLLLVHNQYLNCLTAGLGLLFSLIFFWLYILISRCRTIFRLITFIVFSVMLYYVAGGSYLLFGILCGIFEFLIKRNPLIGLFNILLTLIIPYIIGVYIFVVSIIDAYARNLPFHPESYSNASPASWSLYIFFPLAALLLSLWRHIVKLLQRRPAVKTASKIKAKKSSQITDVSDFYGKSKSIFLYESLVLFIITAGVILFSFDKHNKTILQINCFSYNERWHQVLDKARSLPIEKYNLLVNHDVNKALYYTGRLPYDMFSYPQKLQALISLGFLTMDKTFSLADLPKLTDTFIRLGLINNAEHTANEAMELIGEYPAILRQLFFINIVKKNTQAARVYLNALSRDIVSGKWAKRSLCQLDKDHFMSGDRLIQHLRSMKVNTNNVGSFTIEGILYSLLHSKQSRMSFEYLMAYYLLSLNLDKFVQNIHLLDDFGYPDIPYHYEEAILIYMNKSGEKVELYGKNISQDTLQRFQGFFNILKSYNWNKNLAINVLAREFGNSYFFYYTYGFSGAKK